MNPNEEIVLSISALEIYRINLVIFSNNDSFSTKYYSIFYLSSFK